MKNKLLALVAAGLAVPAFTAPAAIAQPAPPAPPLPPPADAGPPPDNGIVASGAPGTVQSPDGWVLTVAATGETQLPIAPLTTAVSSLSLIHI